MHVAEHLAEHVGGEGIDATYADAVQAAADLVRTFVELSAGMQHRHDHLQGADALLLMNIHGNTTAVVLDGDGIVFVDRHFDVCAEAGERLVDRVVNGFIDEVVQSLLADVADIHGRALADGFESFKHLDI